MKATLTAVMLAVLVAAAGEIRINSLDVEADRAVSVTGVQSNRIEAVVAHTNSTSNPHAVTLAQAAAAGGFAGTETINPLSIETSAGSSRATMGQGGVQVSDSDNGRFLALDATLGLVFSFDTDNFIWRINGSTLDYTGGPDNITRWSFSRDSGDYNVAATSDLAPKLDRSGGTATNLSVSGILTASTIKDATSAGGSIQNAAGQPCITWGAGNGQGVTFANGVNVSGSLAVSGAATLTNTAVNGSFTLNGDNLASRTNEWRRIPWGAMDATALISAHQTLRSTGASGASVSGVSVCESLCLYRADFVNNSSSTNIAVIAQRANYAGALTGPAHTNAITVSGAYVSVLFALPAAESSEYDFVRIRYENAGGGTLSNFLYFRAFYERRATASEVTAYAAGWRPM